MSEYVTLGLGITASGSYPTAGCQYLGAQYFFEVNGTFDSGSIKLQCLSPGQSVWRDVPNSSMTAPGVVLLKLGRGCMIKAVVVANASTNLDATLTPYDGN